MNTKELAMKIAAHASDKKANDILLLNMEGLSPVTDYFVICSASNSMLVKAIFFTHKEGYSDARWILMDYGDVVVHIFLEEERDFYNLEQLWADAPSEAFVENEE